MPQVPSSLPEDQRRQKIERLVDRMDQDAESINAHDFVTTHRALAVLAVKTVGVDTTLKLMQALARERGLPGLTGVCGRPPKRGPILERLKLSTNWAAWSLSGVRAPKGQTT